MEPAESKVFTLAEYLELEASSSEKYEFMDGYVRSMAGGSIAHSVIAGNMGILLGNGIWGDEKCTFLNPDGKIFVEATNSFYYADAVVFCDDDRPEDENKNAITNPVLIVEVLSDSTEAFDRGEKFLQYQRLRSFSEYVLIRQDKPVVEVYFKTETGFWRYNLYTGLAAKLTLKSLNVEISLRDIYRNVKGLKSV